jgi:transposase
VDVIIERACGMDVHKDNITACIMTPEGKEIQTFSAKTVFLLKLVDWIKLHGCTHVAMESTSVYWKPIVNLIEAEDIEFLVVNAQHMKAVPGRKTDVKDAEWIYQLLRHGLIKASFIPNRDQRELRELVRYHRSIIEERAGSIIGSKKFWKEPISSWALLFQILWAFHPKTCFVRLPMALTILKNLPTWPNVR